MTAVALALFTLAIAYVMVWSIKNDDAKSIDAQSGLIKMRTRRRPDRDTGFRKGGTEAAALARRARDRLG
jgi:hypothetical protein